MLKPVLLIRFVETVILFSEFFYQYKIQKDRIHLKYKYLYFNIIINVFHATLNQFSLAQ